ncbi:hypothetical protein EVAR_46124_1 [Eumeta japonica]|uniref:Uncharacterized protein n=1 Tax=Eumeta variegata TaxID=151549 RepID=A0A4C1XQ26_EUMVA|nr:hypothetical protein EVAR_46124_1 [Eumeta japonica]
MARQTRQEVFFLYFASNWYYTHTASWTAATALWRAAVYRQDIASYPISLDFISFNLCTYIAKKILSRPCLQAPARAARNQLRCWLTEGEIYLSSEDADLCTAQETPFACRYVAHTGRFQRTDRAIVKFCLAT